MIYLDIIMTDKEKANEITPIVDHKAFLIKDVLKKPKMGLWELYKLKKLLETGYQRLEEAEKLDGKENNKIQSSSKDSRKRTHSRRK